MKRYLILAFIAILHAASCEQIEQLTISCKNHGDCVAFSTISRNASCNNNGLCVCKDETGTRNCTKADILPKKDINEDVPIPCQTDQDCNNIQKTLNDPLCKGGFCVCKNETLTRNCTTADIMNQTHRNTGPLGFRSCKIDQECTFPRGFCNTTGNHCDCKPNYVLTSNKQQCLEKATGYNFTCLDEKQCSAFFPNFTCLNNKCVCGNGYHYVENACYSNVAFGNACTQSQECSHVDGAICNDKKMCGCPAETVISMDKKKCLPVARIFLQECMENDQCSITFPHSRCIDKTCQCQDQYHFESAMERCFISKALDEECGNSFECYQVNDDNTTVKALECVENKCICAQDYYREDNACVSGAATIVSSTLAFLILSMLVYGSSASEV